MDKIRILLDPCVKLLDGHQFNYHFMSSTHQDRLKDYQIICITSLIQ